MCVIIRGSHGHLSPELDSHLCTSLRHGLAACRAPTTCASGHSRHCRNQKHCVQPSAGPPGAPQGLPAHLLRPIPDPWLTQHPLAKTLALWGFCWEVSGPSLAL